MCNNCSPVLCLHYFGVLWGGGEGNWGRRGRSEGGVRKQEGGRDGEEEGRKESGRKSRKVGKEGAEGGRTEEGDGGEKVREKENNNTSHLYCSFYLQMW